MDIEKKIEAILFFRGEPVSRKRLQEILSASAKASDGQGKLGQAEINEAVEKLKENLAGRGIVLQEKENELALGTAPEFSSLILHLQKKELNKELSRASLETLSILLYKGGASRADIDYIRGVNSSFILRALSVRGLVERIIDPEDNRRYLYKPTFELLSFMGIKNLEELPEWPEVKTAINSAIANGAEATS